jgi:hypothetical protein
VHIPKLYPRQRKNPALKRSPGFFRCHFGILVYALKSRNRKSGCGYMKRYPSVRKEQRFSLESAAREIIARELDWSYSGIAVKKASLRW